MAEAVQNHTAEPNIIPCSPEKLYLAHTLVGRSLRSLAQEQGVHPSTVLRRVQRMEERRDDPLIDAYLDKIATTDLIKTLKEMETMTQITPLKMTPEEIRILRRLCESRVFMAIAPELEKGALLRQETNAPPTRISVIGRDMAQTFAMRDWVRCAKPQKGAVHSYYITDAGRSAVRRAIAMNAKIAGGDETSIYAAQHRDMEDKDFIDEDGVKIRARVNLRESPLTMLARKKGVNGSPFLSRELLAAGERLREDFELAQMGPRITQNWERLMSGRIADGGFESGAGGCSLAAERLRHALSALGVGLGDIALRTCCYLEGLESAERHMGWSARSGKIVLRIALQQLLNHYDKTDNGVPPMIG